MTGDFPIQNDASACVNGNSVCAVNHVTYYPSTCPSCGSCPTCGRSNGWTYRPNWYINPNVNWSIAAPSTTGITVTSPVDTSVVTISYAPPEARA